MTGGFFNFSADEEIADIRISPATARLKVETIGLDAVKQLTSIPRLLAAPNGRVIGWNTAIVRHAGPVLEQLTKREWLTVERFV